MTCKECISFHVCGKSHRRQFPEQKGAEYTCKHFTDKDLINRLQEEKEALINGQETLQKYIAEQKAEVERLKTELDFAKAFRKETDAEFSLMHRKYGNMLKTAKVEAYKEFGEKLLLCYEGFDEVNEVITYQNLVTAVNDTLKEMAGEDK